MSKIVIDARESGTTSGRYVDKLIEYLALAKPKHKFVVLAKKNRVEFLHKIAPRFEIIETPYKEFTFSEQLGFWRQLHQLKPDLVHFPMVQQPILYQGKVVTTMQDLTTLRFRNPSKNRFVFVFKRWVYKWVNKIAAFKSKAILTPTEFVKNDVAKFTRTNSRKIIVTLEAADSITDEPELVEELVDSHFVMYVGRPLPHKNLDRLVEAFALAKQQVPDLKLVLVGKTDTLYKRLERKIKARHIPDVIFTGFVSEGQLRWLYEHAAVYAFPSLSEGFGLPSLEAMLHGCPVVSSDATCLPEVNGDAVEYFDPLDTEDMARAITKVVTKESIRQTLIEKGRKQAAQYSWKRMAQQTLDVYNSVLVGDK